MNADYGKQTAKKNRNEYKEHQLLKKKTNKKKLDNREDWRVVIADVCSRKGVKQMMKGLMRKFYWHFDVMFLMS